MLLYIYVVRHGFRMNWTVDAATGAYTTNTRTPTGIPSDPALASYGVDQAKQLAAKLVTLKPPPNMVYSSPFYRCLETLKPAVGELARLCGTDTRVRVEPGLGEFFGTARFVHPAPASLQTLNLHFPFLKVDYEPFIVPNPNGETITDLHDRVAYTLHRIIEEADEHPAQPVAILICTHAATMICIGRALTGNMPEDVNKADFNCGTCALSTYDRLFKTIVTEKVEHWDPTKVGYVPRLRWRKAGGVMGAWNSIVNGDCSHLRNGEERPWSFSMEAGHAGNRGADGNTSWVNITPSVMEAALGLMMLQTTPVVGSPPAAEAAAILTQMKHSKAVEVSEMAEAPDVIESSSESDEEMVDVSKRGQTPEVIEVSSGSDEEMVDVSKTGKEPEVIEVSDGSEEL